jgi:hypothetical protein
MSDYLAVGGVSAVLRWLLISALPSGGPSTILTATPAVSAVSPDLIPAVKGEEPRVNLFMYYTSLNPALRNLDMPSADSAGNPISNPPLALNLHYLVSAYGSTQFDAEILLGWAMKVFHDTPVVPSQTIASALAALLSDSSAESKLIATSTLAQQVERLKIIPEPLTSGEIYQLWSAFQAPYRPSTAFEVSVVVVQDTDMVTSNLPVRHHRLVALPMQAPVIDGISPVMSAAGQVLTITGTNFLGQSPADTVLSFDGPAGPVAADLVQGSVVQVTLPASLQAGTRFVRVQRMVTFPAESTPRQGFSSGAAPFQLIPSIGNASPVPATRGATLSLTISPPVGAAQQAALYIGDYAIPIDARPVGSAASGTLGFPIPSTISPQTYPLQVEIDGAQSALTLDAAGQWTPQVTVSLWTRCPPRSTGSTRRYRGSHGPSPRPPTLRRVHRPGRRNPGRPSSGCRRGSGSAPSNATCSCC